MPAKRPKRPERHKSRNGGNAKASAETDSAQDREELIKGIRSRIQQGFYSTEDVLEDLSHAFTKALDIML